MTDRPPPPPPAVGTNAPSSTGAAAAAAAADSSHLPSTSSLSRPPRLHVMKLHESPVMLDDNGSSKNYERLDWQWMMDDEQGTAVPHHQSSTSSSSSEDNASTSDFPGLNPGDLIFFPELLTGAGELEAVRFVGTRRVVAEQQQQQGASSGLFPLYAGGIEAPVFPAEIVNLVEASRSSLQSLYEPLLENVLQRQQSLSLADLFGGAEVVQEFWANPDIQQDESESSSAATTRRSNNIWRIPLRQCTWLETVDGGGGPSSGGAPSL